MAQKTLYDNNKKIVKDYLRSKYSNYYDIDDDVSEIMIKIFMNLATYDPTKSKFKSWVLTIANNYMIDRWRSNQFQFVRTGTITLCSDPSYQFTVGNGVSNPQFPAGDISLSAGDISFTTSNSANGISMVSNGTYTTCNNAEFENCNSINFISQQISVQDYTLLDMKYVQGYEYCEIGKEFNLTSNTVSNRVNYIKTKIKKNHVEELRD